MARRADSVVGSSAGRQVRDKARDFFKTLPDPIQLRVLHALHRRGPLNSGSAPEAPAAPIGMSFAPPDFVGVGVPECGTTWWFSLVMAHPEIHVQNQKELLFFNKSFFRHVNDVGAGEEDLEAYRRWFPRPAGTISGEWTPNYVFFYQLPPF